MLSDLPALDRLIDMYSATVRHSGGDPALGPRLPAHLRAAGLTDIEVRTADNVLPTTSQKLFLAGPPTNMRPAIPAAALASAAELAATPPASRSPAPPAGQR